MAKAAYAEEFLPQRAAKNQHAMSRLAAEHFLPGESDDIDSGQSILWAKAAEVASQIVKPLRSAAIQSPLGTRTPTSFHSR